MGMSTQDMRQRAGTARLAAEQQRAAWRRAMNEGLPAKARHHAEQAVRFARECRQLMARSGAVYW